jgi:hypothetical protein
VEDFRLYRSYFDETDSASTLQEFHTQNSSMRSLIRRSRYCLLFQANGHSEQVLIMSNANLTEKQRREHRLRASSFLKSLGVERTTALMVAAVGVLLFAFFTILGSESADSTDAGAEPVPAADTIAETDEVEVLVLPQ